MQGGRDGPKNCAALSPRSLLWLSSPLWLCVVGNHSDATHGVLWYSAAWQPQIDTNLREAARAGVFRLVLSEFGLTCVLPPSSLLLLRLRLSALLCSCRLGSDRGCVSVRRVVCCLVRTALSWSSPVDLASLAWLLRDEQSSYDEDRSRPK